MARVGRTGKRVVVGPWLSEIGFEVLYWIPLLRRLFERHGVEPAQVTAISRGGVAHWYRGVADSYVDILDLLQITDYRAAQRRRVADAGEQKQYLVMALEHELWRRAGAGGAVRVHPLVMYSRLRYFWGREEGLDALERCCAYQRFGDPGVPALDLPERFVAAKPYFSSCFPDTEENRDLVERLLVQLADSIDVVLLTTGLAMDDHAELERVDHERIHPLDRALTARDNLALQTGVIARAQSLVSTYGGPSYLGPFLGVPSVSFFSLRNQNQIHLEAARFAAKRLGVPPPAVFHATGQDAVERVVEAAVGDGLALSP